MSFALTGSVSVVLIVAVLTSCPALRGLTRTVTVAFAPLASVPSSQVTFLPDCLHDPCDGFAPMKSSWFGSVSTTWTPFAFSGPSLESASR